jgi:hypothetical protein
MRASKAFRRFLDREQAASGIPSDKRIKVVVTQRATKPELFEKRSLVRPIFLFLLINMGFLALAFALENLRPRRQPPQEGSGPGTGEPERDGRDPLEIERELEPVGHPVRAA